MPKLIISGLQEAANILIARIIARTSKHAIYIYRERERVDSFDKVKAIETVMYVQFILWWLCLNILY